MTFRGTFRNGVIIPEEGATLREGDAVEIQVRRRRTPVSKKTTKSSSTPRGTARSKTLKKRRTVNRNRMTRKQRLELFLQSFGMWKDKPEWKGRSTEEIAREIRVRALRGSPRG